MLSISTESDYNFGSIANTVKSHWSKITLLILILNTKYLLIGCDFGAFRFCLMTTGKSLLFRSGGIVGKIMGWVWQCDDWQLLSCSFIPPQPQQKYDRCENPAFKKGSSSTHGSSGISVFSTSDKQKHVQ